MELIAGIIGSVDAFIWGVPMIVLLLGTHLYSTVRTGFIQRKLPLALKLSVTKDPDAEGDISNFGALCTAISATLGTGNIIGVGTAIAAGGPGAVFWMWLTGIFGMATKYSETLLAIKYRVKDYDGKMLGGAMYTWRRAFMSEESRKAKKIASDKFYTKIGATLFCVFTLLASLGIGSAVQTSAMSDCFAQFLPGVPLWVFAIVITLFTAVVIFGSINLISQVCEILVPLICLLYVGGCIAIICINAEYIWLSVCVILESAFSGKAVFGGFLGSGIAAALQFGCARGLFSNESGMGSSPIVASAASTRNPVRQSLVAMTATFWGTVVICLLTGLVIVTTMCANQDSLSAFFAVDAGSVLDGTTLVVATFNQVPMGNVVLVCGIVLFAYSTIIGWAYYGDRCMTYLFGKHGKIIYKIIYLAAGFVGVLGVGDAAWAFADIMNALMAVPNIIIVVALAGIVSKETKHYVWDKNIDEKDDTWIPVVKME